MVIDLLSLKRELRCRRIPMRAFFRLAKLSRLERACVLNGVRVSSYAVARMCGVLSCPQAALLLMPSSREAQYAAMTVE